MEVYRVSQRIIAEINGTLQSQPCGNILKWLVPVALFNLLTPTQSLALTLLPGQLLGPASLPAVCCLFCDAQTHLRYLENERLSIIHHHHPGNVDLGAMEHSIRSLYPQCTE